ncbi:MAG TPA: 2-phospho-L-lactate guanylyltransferase [Dehalococcoidia bacterium]|nr:2-phospho-L-lactate guanylyltransferase [Dehalococcoidia bacterium]
MPVRGLPAGKQRLAALLSVEQRNLLVRAMLADVVETLRMSPCVEAVTIVSGDAAAAREAERLGVGFLRQPEGLTGLNAGLSFAQGECVGRDAILVVPADLPLVTPEDVSALVTGAPDGPVVGVAPSRDEGTNGLFLRPPDVIGPLYGPESSKRHAEAAQAAGVAVHWVDEGRWRLDVDTPEDLGQLVAEVREGSARQTLACLRSSGFPSL